MAYDPMSYNPYGLQMPGYAPPQIHQPQKHSGTPVMYVVQVNDLAEAREYREQPGALTPLFMLEQDNVFIKKDFDEQGGVKFSAYRFSEIPLSDIMPTEGNYVTKADFDAFANKVMEALNGKRSTEPSETTATEAGKFLDGSVEPD